MGKNTRVNPDHYKIAGRGKPGSAVLVGREKQDFVATRRPAARRARRAAGRRVVAAATRPAAVSAHALKVRRSPSGRVAFWNSPIACLEHAAALHGRSVAEIPFITSLRSSPASPGR